MLRSPTALRVLISPLSDARSVSADETLRAADQDVALLKITRAARRPALQLTGPRPGGVLGI